MLKKDVESRTWQDNWGRTELFKNKRHCLELWTKWPGNLSPLFAKITLFCSKGGREPFWLHGRETSFLNLSLCLGPFRMCFLQTSSATTGILMAFYVPKKCSLPLPFLPKMRFPVSGCEITLSVYQEATAEIKAH